MAQSPRFNQKNLPGSNEVSHKKKKKNYNKDLPLVLMRKSDEHEKAA